MPSAGPPFVREFMTQPALPPAGCLIANLSMPDMAGLELQRELTAQQWPLPVIFLTSPDDCYAACRQDAMPASGSAAIA
jgi:FixJ family two-component response regulator